MVIVKRLRNIRDFHKAIIQEATNNKKKVLKSFIHTITEQEFSQILVAKNWIYISKYLPISYNYELIHEFVCKPFKKELKAYIYTSVDECYINNVIIQVED